MDTANGILLIFLFISIGLIISRLFKLSGSKMFEFLQVFLQILFDFFKDILKTFLKSKKRARS